MAISPHCSLKSFLVLNTRRDACGELICTYKFNTKIYFYKRKSMVKACVDSKIIVEACVPIARDWLFRIFGKFVTCCGNNTFFLVLKHKHDQLIRISCYCSPWCNFHDQPQSCEIVWTMDGFYKSFCSDAKLSKEFCALFSFCCLLFGFRAKQFRAPWSQQSYSAEEHCFRMHCVLRDIFKRCRSLLQR